jgi:hypothetical protein
MTRPSKACPALAAFWPAVVSLMFAPWDFLASSALLAMVALLSPSRVVVLFRMGTGNHLSMAFCRLPPARARVSSRRRWPMVFGLVE